MPDLISMRKSATERQAESKPSALVYDVPEYPYQLRIYLDDEVMAKLDMELPAVGTQLVLVARADVCSVSLSDDKEGGPRKSMAIQITAMRLEPVKEEKSLADKLYGG